MSGTVPLSFLSSRYSRDLKRSFKWTRVHSVAYPGILLDGGGGGGVAHQWIFPNVALKYAVKVRRHTPWSRVRCHGCRFKHRQFHSQFHSRRHSLRITLKYTTLVCMRSSNAWTMKPWQRSEWRLGFNAYSSLMTFLGWEAWIQEPPPPPPNMPLSSLSY